MKKYLFLAAVVAAVAMSCSKDNLNKDMPVCNMDGSFVKGEEAAYSFSVTDQEETFRDIYMFKNPDSLIWTWRRFENDEFVFEFDHVWPVSETAIGSVLVNDVTGEISIVFADGEIGVISNFVQNGEHIAFDYEIDEQLFAFEMEVPNAYPFISCLMSYSNGSLNEPGPIVAFFKRVVMALQEYFRCQYYVNYHYAQCVQSECRAVKTDFSITCYSNSADIEEQQKCNKFSYQCSL